VATLPWLAVTASKHQRFGEKLFVPSPLHRENRKARQDALARLARHTFEFEGAAQWLD